MELLEECVLTRIEGNILTNTMYGSYLSITSGVECLEEVLKMTTSITKIGV